MKTKTKIKFNRKTDLYLKNKFFFYRIFYEMERANWGEFIPQFIRESFSEKIIIQKYPKIIHLKVDQILSVSLISHITLN